MFYGCAIVGIAGSGKSTFCKGMKQFVNNLSAEFVTKQRKIYTVNLDPAADPALSKNNDDEIKNEHEGVYDIDIMQLNSVQDVMDKHQLGPNGALLYCMEFLYDNREWLDDAINNLTAYDQDAYFIFDFPGQVELFTHNNSAVALLCGWLQQQMHIQLCVVNLIDCTHCIQPTKFISAVMLSTQIMLCLEYPFVNVLSKCDLLSQFQDELPLDFEELRDCRNLTGLLSMINADTNPQLHRLNEAVCDVLSDFHYVSYQQLNVQDQQSMMSLLQIIDNANGFAYVATLEAKERESQESDMDKNKE